MGEQQVCRRVRHHACSLPASADIDVFPDPALSSLTVRLEGTSRREFDVELRNTLGALVLRTSVVSGPHGSLQLPVSHLPSGSYVLIAHPRGAPYSTPVTARFVKL